MEQVKYPRICGVLALAIKARKSPSEGLTHWQFLIPLGVMTSEQLKASLMQAAVEFSQAIIAYNKAKDKFDRLYEETAATNGSRSKKTPVHQLVLHRAEGALTDRILKSLPADGSPMHIKQLSALVGRDTKTISGTCSNLRQVGKIESAGRGLWRIKQEDLLK